MKKVIIFASFVITLSLCSCGGSGNSDSEGSYNPSFQGRSGNRLVELRSFYGGVSYGYGTFYEGSMVVVLSSTGTRLKVSYSDTSNWKYMIVFDRNTKWYFN